MDVFNELIHAGIDQMVPMILKAFPYALLLFRPVLRLIAGERVFVFCIHNIGNPLVHSVRIIQDIEINVK